MRYRFVANWPFEVADALPRVVSKVLLAAGVEVSFVLRLSGVALSCGYGGINALQQHGQQSVMKSMKKIVPLYGKCRLMERKRSGASVATGWFDLAAEVAWDEAVRNVGVRSSDGYWVLGDKLIVLDLNQAPSPAA